MVVAHLPHAVVVHRRSDLGRVDGVSPAAAVMWAGLTECRLPPHRSAGVAYKFVQPSVLA
eukprot:350211-Chlamydomonas_euryale.AAC.2